MAVALLTHTKGNGANTFTTPAINTSGATLIVLGASFLNTTPPVLSDSKGNTWIAGGIASGTNGMARIWYAVNPTVGSGHTFTATQTGMLCTLCVASFSGTGAHDLDAVGGSSTASGGGCAPGPITASVANELFVSHYETERTGTIASPPVGFTVIEENDLVPATSFLGALGYTISSGTPNPLWTTNGAAGREGAVMSSFLAVTAVRPVQPQPFVVT